MPRLATGRIGRPAVWLALMVVLGAAPLGASGGEPLALRYQMSWAGLAIAALHLQHEADDHSYRAALEVETTGLADKLLQYRARSRATGMQNGTEQLIPARFESAYESRSKDRTILVRFDPDTSDVTELALTKRGEPDRSKVPAALQKGVIDPLSAFFQVRRRIAGGQPGAMDDFTAAVFDGRRRFELEARLVGRERIEVAGRSWTALKVALSLTWIAGSNRDDLGGATSDQDTLRLELFLSDDERLIPLQMHTIGSVLGTKIELLPCGVERTNCPALSG